MADTETLGDVAALRTRYADPGAGVRAKVIHSLDDNCRAFLAHCPFFVLATADANGRADASPRGGHPGLITMLDAQHVAWADLQGNNLLDSFQNIVANPHVGLLCMIPGLDETLRINGTATLSTDPELCAQLATDGRVPKVVVVVEVADAYIHCAKALRRGGLWDTAAWPDRADMPTIACMLRDHVRFDGDASVIEAGLEHNYQATMWEPGG
jgi:uncharacterized protein